MKYGDYIPDRGDFVWLSFSPQTGHEQAGRRPALCLTPQEYNKKTYLELFVPVTSKVNLKYLWKVNAQRELSLPIM